jgi:hypothetical protein
LCEHLEEQWLKLNIDGESRGNLGLQSVWYMMRDYAWFTKTNYFVFLYQGENKIIEDMKGIKCIELVVKHLGI